MIKNHVTIKLGYIRGSVGNLKVNSVDDILSAITTFDVDAFIKTLYSEQTLVIKKVRHKR